MNKYQELFDFLDNERMAMPKNIDTMYQEVKMYFEKADKPAMTETGIQLMEYLQANPDRGFKANEIAQDLGVSSRKVAGGMRKLVTDGYVTKMGQNPVIYSLTEQGKNTDISSFKGE